MSVRTERKKEHKRIALALAISLLIHLIILVIALIVLSMRPSHRQNRAAPTPAPEPMRLTILPQPPPPKPTEKEKEFFDSSQGQVSAKPAPKKSDFESDRDTAAASELPAESDRQVPTTNGENTPGLTLTAQNLSLGPARQPSPPSPASPAKPAPPVEKPKAKPEPTPPDKQVAKTTPTPKPTPRPEDTELAMLDPTRPKPKPPAEQPKPTPEQQMPPSRPQTPGFQPQTRVTRLTGGISNRGRASIGADASPLGKYKKQVSDAIGSRWYYYVSDMIDLVNVGAVQLNFVVRKDGTIEGVKVVRNTSNESLASCSVRAIIEAEIPPMPKEVANAVAGGKIEVDFTFSVIR